MNLKRPTAAELSQMSHAEKDALILMLFDVIEQLTKRLNEIEAKVEKNSRNSSKPPASDGLKKGPAKPRQRGQHRTGGQLGHTGQTRTWSDHPDHVIYLQPQGVCSCGIALDLHDSEWVDSRQQIDIPRPQHEVTEFRQMQTVCRCGRKHRGEYPSDVTPHVSFGSRLKSYAVGLVLGHFLSLQRTTQLIQDQYGVKPSQGSVQNWLEAAAERLKPDYEAYRETLRQAPVAHFDESGLRVNGKLHWLHVAVSENAVYYIAHEKRGQEAMHAAGVLTEFKGRAVHDHWKPYRTFTDCQHALCNAHHLRELNYCEEITEHHWPKALRELLLEGKEAVAKAREANETALAPEVIESLNHRYDRLIERGLAACPVKKPETNQKGRVKQHEATHLLLRLRDFKEQVLAYLTDWQVPFDNNLAERMVRPVKVKLKVSGGFRSLGGSQVFCILRSVWETNKLQGINPFDSLRLAFGG